MVSTVKTPIAQNTIQYPNQQHVQPQYAQAAAYAYPNQPQNITIQAPSSQYCCTTYANNPYTCAYSPTSNLVIPQGQMQMISSPTNGVPNVQAIQNQNSTQPQRSVNYNQVAPYINTDSAVLNPSVKARSGQAIATASTVAKPLNEQEAQIVYQGPVRIINPQITPVEQSDNEIEKQYRKYFDKKSEFNNEMRKVLHNQIGLEEKKSSFWSKAAKILGAVIIIGLTCKYRHKIPILKRFCK